MALQTVNLADHINAGIDKINENFVLLEWAADSNTIGDIINNYIDSSTINNLIDQSQFFEIIDSDFIQSIVNNVIIEGSIDSAQLYQAIGETGIVARLDSVEGGFVILSQQFTNLSTSYQNLDEDISALSTANASLTSQITVLDSSIEVLSQDLVDLEAQFIGGIELDSATIVQAVGGAVQNLESRINATDSSISVISQAQTDLSADLALLDSEMNVLVAANGSAIQALTTSVLANDSAITVISQFQTNLSADLNLLDSEVTANATAISNLIASTTANSDEIEVLSGRFDSFQVTLQQAIDSGLTIDPDQVADAVGGVSQDLYSRIYANSDAISVVSADVTELDAKLVLLDSNGALTNVVAEAVQELRTEVISRDSDGLASAISEFNTALEAYIDSDQLATAQQTLRSEVTAGDSSTLATARSELNTALSSKVDSSTLATAEQTLRAEATAGDSNTLASAVSEFETKLAAYIDSGTFATATQALYLAIDSAGTEVGYTLNLDPGTGHVAGIEFNNNGATADMIIIADKFGIVNANDNAVKPFTVQGDDVLLSNATVTGQLNISSTGNNGSMTMTNDVMQIFDAAGNPRVKFGRLS